MEPAVIAALITAAVTLVVLLITQVVHLVQARRQGEQARLAELRDTRRETYAAFLRGINASVKQTRSREVDVLLGGHPSPADMCDPWEIQSVLPSELEDALQQVQLIGEAGTATAAAELESMTRTYAWDWSPDVAEKIPGAVRAFTEAARADLGVARAPRNGVAVNTTQRAILDEVTIESMVKLSPDNVSVARGALAQHVAEYQPGACLPNWVDESYLAAVASRIQRRAFDRDRVADVHREDEHG